MRTKLVHFVITNWYSIVWIISCLFSLTGSYRTAGSPDCGHLSSLNLSNTEHVLLQNDTKYTLTANISCRIGYTNGNQHQTVGISTTMVICSENGTWENLPNCVKKDCGDVRNVRIEHAAYRTLLNGDTKYNAKAEVTCDLGYYDTDQNQTTGVSKRTLLCSYIGIWTNIPKCIPKDCHDMKVFTIAHTAQSRYNDTKFNSTAEIDCEDGYYDPRQNQTPATSTTIIKCSEQGFWTNIPNCIRKDCGDVQNIGIKHTANRTLLNKNTKYNATAEVTCDLGYYDAHQNQTTGVTKRTLLCSYTGKWTNIPKCLPKDCHDVKDIDIIHAAQRRYNDTKFNSTAEIDCKDGYYDPRQNQTPATSTTIIKCSERGFWTNIPNCIRKDCGSLEMLNISNAANRLFFTDTKYGSNAAVTCNTGYYDKKFRTQMKGVSSTLIKCSENGTWVKVPKCVRKDCGNLTDITITNAVHRRLYTDTKFESIADIDCDDGYYIKGRIQTAGISTQTITCSDTGTWINVPECVPKDCGRLDQLNLSNAKDRSLINVTTIYTSLANISCDEGYKELNSSQVLGITTTVVRCNENGTWENLPKCVRKDCGDVQNIRIEHAANRTLLNKNTKYNATAEVTCDLGYYDTDQHQTTGVSKRTLLCSFTGKWTNIPKCIPKDCGNVAYLDIRNANNRRENNGTEYNSTAEIDCDAGFHNKDITQTRALSTTTIKCSDRGTWIDIPTCVSKDCGLVSPPANGEILFNQNSTIYDSKATYICSEGYNMIGQANITCEPSGNWDYKKTYCEIKDCGLLMPPKDGFVVTLNGTNFGASSEFRCNPGFTLYGDYFTTCLSNGTWHNYHVNCIPDKKAVPAICFSCDGMSSPEYCDKVEHCQPNQICYTESYQTDYGKVFRSGCMDEQQCHREENSTSNFVCVECCASEMCNNKGCGNADFPPREDRGPMCFDCQHIGDINSCRKVTMCASDQVCSIEKQQWGDTYHYKLGCTHHLCNSLLHQISGTASSCHGCCSDDYCNKNCTSSSSSPGAILVG